MNKLLPILALLFFSCDEDNPVVAMQESVLGCTDSTACNYNSDADTDDGTCGYQEFSCYSSSCASDLTISNTNLLRGTTLSFNNLISAKRFILNNGEWVEFDIQLGGFATLFHHILTDQCVDEGFVVDLPGASEFLYDNCIVSVFTNQNEIATTIFYWYVEDNTFVALTSADTLIPQGIYQIEITDTQVTLRQNISSTEYTERTFSLNE